MVELKEPCEPCFQSCLESGFNRSMVELKVLFESEEGVVASRFNRSMVELKERMSASEVAVSG